MPNRKRKPTEYHEVSNSAQRFDRLMRGLVAVPKEEVEKKLAEREQQVEAIKRGV